MSTDNGNRTGAPAPTWVTHAYPPGPQPAAPAPLPAPYTAETTPLPSQTSIDMLAEKLHAPARRPRRSVRGWLVPAVTAAVVAAVGLAGGYAIGSGTPASCVEALEYADELHAQSTELGGAISDAFDALAALDQAAMESAESEIQRIGEERDGTYAAYKDAAESCRAEGVEI